jgi:hypothetical protein
VCVQKKEGIVRVHLYSRYFLFNMRPVMLVDQPRTGRNMLMISYYILYHIGESE